MTVSGDGRFAAGGRGNEICIYSRLAGRIIAVNVRSEFGITRRGIAIFGQFCLYCPDGTLLASGGYREVKLWRKSAVQQTIKLPEGPIASTADGKLLAIGGADVLITLLTTVNHEIRAVHCGDGEIRAICLSPDSTRFAIVEGTADEFAIVSRDN